MDYSIRSQTFFLKHVYFFSMTKTYIFSALLSEIVIWHLRISLTSCIIQSWNSSMEWIVSLLFSFIITKSLTFFPISMSPSASCVQSLWFGGKMGIKAGLNPPAMYSSIMPSTSTIKSYRKVSSPIGVRILQTLHLAS